MISISNVLYGAEEYIRNDHLRVVELGYLNRRIYVVVARLLRLNTQLKAKKAP